MALDSQVLYLSRADVERVAPDMRTIIDLLEAAFREKARGAVEMPPKPGLHTMPDAFIHAMPAYIPAHKAAGIKWVGGYPSNQARGLPYISGLLILNDVETGFPYAVMDCTWITAYRTGAASALSAKYLARPESETAGILACGVQGRTNLLALAALFPLKRVFAYDIDPAVQERYVREMSALTGLEIVGVGSPKAAVVESDLIVTAGPILKQPNPSIQPGWVKPGAFASAVDFDSYWTTQALAEFDKIATDDFGQFHYYKTHGYFQAMREPYAALDELVGGLKPGRQRPDERTLATNLGLGLEDIAVAPTIFTQAKARGIGTWLPL
jgi:ornithine cyclodeaminase/alanine dehydrogenase-like protein (mu-crystallin family)